MSADWSESTRDGFTRQGKHPNRISRETHRERSLKERKAAATPWWVKVMVTLLAARPTPVRWRKPNLDLNEINNNGKNRSFYIHKRTTLQQENLAQMSGQIHGVCIVLNQVQYDRDHQLMKLTITPHWEKIRVSTSRTKGEKKVTRINNKCQL